MLDSTCWDEIQEEVGAAPESETEAADVDVESVESWDSEGSMSSNDLDQGLTVEPNRQWCTKEDSDLERIRNLADAFKEHPLLPPTLPGFDVHATDHTSGVLFP